METIKENTTHKENNTNEVIIEVNDANQTHNNNHSIALKSKNIDVDVLLPMAEKWLQDFKQKKWLER